MPRLLAPRYWGAHLLAVVGGGGGGGARGLAVRRVAGAAGRRGARPDPAPSRSPLDDAIGPDDPFPGDQVGQPVISRAPGSRTAPCCVSGREHDGRDGYWVVTPVAVDGAGRAGAAGRARLGRRARTTHPRRRPGDAELVGWLQPPEGTGEADPDPDDDVLPQVRIADLVQRVDQDLYGAYAVVADEPATNDGTDGLEPATLAQLPDVGRFTALRNLLYAFEWWFFGAFALFIWWRWLRDEQAAGEAQPTPDPDRARRACAGRWRGPVGWPA